MRVSHKPTGYVCFERPFISLTILLPSLSNPKCEIRLFNFAADPHYHMFITLLIGQAAVIIILICALVHWVRKKTRQNSTHSPLDRSDSNKTNDEIYQPCKCIFSGFFFNSDLLMSKEIMTFC